MNLGDEHPLFAIQRVLAMIQYTQGSHSPAPLNSSYLDLIEFELNARRSPVTMSDILGFEFDVLISEYIGAAPFTNDWQVRVLDAAYPGFGQEFIAKEYGVHDTSLIKLVLPHLNFC